jgi:cytoskeleton protein RodZ
MVRYRYDMPKLGEMLRAARQDMGVSLAEVEQATKIRLRFLVALEEEDFSCLPETVYVMGFLRQYASYLRLDPDMAAKVFKEQSGRRDLPGVQPETRIVREATRRGAISLGGISALLIFAGLLVLGVYGYQYYLRIQDAVQPPAVAQTSPTPLRAGSAPSAAAAPAVAASPSPMPSPTATVTTGVVVELRVVNGSCWIRAIADDVVVTKNNDQGETLNPGEIRIFKADRYVHLRVGNAGAADVTFNGIREGTMGPTGAVREKEWSSASTR